MQRGFENGLTNVVIRDGVAPPSKPLFTNQVHML